MERASRDSRTKSAACDRGFRGNTLEDIAAEFNRWNRRPIRIVGTPLAGRVFDGALDSDDPQSLLDFLRTEPQLEVRTDGEEIVIRAKAVH
jgi:ferric-dicitrate binding protein FerR (iron transport regulator)